MGKNRCKEGGGNLKCVQRGTRETEPGGGRVAEWLDCHMLPTRGQMVRLAE